MVGEKCVNTQKFNLYILPFFQQRQELINISLRGKRGLDKRLDPLSNFTEQSFFPGAASPACSPAIPTASLWEHGSGQMQDQKPPWHPSWRASAEFLWAIKPAHSLLVRASGMAQLRAIQLTLSSFSHKRVLLSTSLTGTSPQSMLSPALCPSCLFSVRFPLPCWPLPISTIFLQRNKLALCYIQA